MIHLRMGLPAPDNLQLMVPFHNKPWSIRRLARKFPALKEDLDGSAAECTLLWFYRLESGILVFKDAEFEDEMAELMGVTWETFNDIERSADSEQPAMTAEEIAAFKEALAENREALQPKT